MMQRKLKKIIVSSYSNATPDCLEQIKSTCEGVEQVDYDIYLNNEKNKTGYLACRLFALSFCMLVVIMSCFILKRTFENIPGKEPQDAICQNTNIVELQKEDTTANQNISLITEQLAVVYLDVNPSIEIKINNEMKVIECIAVNADAEVIIKDMNLEGKDFNEALDLVLNSLKNHGYLQGETDGILVSVDTDVEGMYDSVQQSVELVLRDNSLECELFTQVINNDERTKELAREYRVSEGKITFVNKVIESSVDYSENDILELAGRSIKNLFDIMDGIISSNPIVSASGEEESSVENKNQESGNLVTDTYEKVDEIIDDQIDSLDKEIDVQINMADEIADDLLGTDNVVGEAIDEVHSIVDDSINFVDDIITQIIK